MGPPLTPARLAHVRATIARAICPASATDATLGSITLHDRQIAGIRRGRDALARYGGVLVAHDVGSGKTFVALALARDFVRPVILAPAALRATWADATLRARATIPFVSLESLGHGRPPPLGHDVVIIDEAHHVRNPATRTYEAVRRATRGARVILLTATPIHNSSRDLDALLSLFLGADARDIDESERARVMLRDVGSSAGPAVETHAPIAIADSADVIAAVNTLPPPFAPRDGAVAADLLRLSLLRAWCSSAGAFDAMLRRASLRTAALVDALRAGRHLTRAELTAWSPADDGQLAFIEIIASGTTGGAHELAVAEKHLDALNALRSLARAQSTLDDERAAHLRTIAAAHAGTAVLACTQYASTVEALWRRLRREAGVAALTSRGAQIASGAISRDDALARFSPLAQGKRPPHERERIRLLIATDLVSEGLNLHDAGVVVHVDLPWTAARVAQRVGRVARFGSAHACVHSYQISAPGGAEAVLNIARRVRAKRRIAACIVGGDKRLAELLGDVANDTESPAEAHARIIGALSEFAGEEVGFSVAGICAVIAPIFGWLALIGPTDADTRREPPRLVAKLGRARPTTNPAAVVRAVAYLTEGDECPAFARWTQSTAEATRWLSQDRAGRLAGTMRRFASRTHGREVAVHIGAVAAAPPHERARAARTAASGLQALHTTMSVRAADPPEEQVLLALVVFCRHDGTTNHHPV